MNEQSETWLVERVRLASAQAGQKAKQFGFDVLDDENQEPEIQSSQGAKSFSYNCYCSPEARKSRMLIRRGFMRAGVWALQRAEPVLAAMSSGKPFKVLVGMRPSSRYHLGHLTLMRELHWLVQKGGEPVFIIASYEAGKYLHVDELSVCINAFRKCYQRFTGANLPESCLLFSDRDDSGLRLLEDEVAENISFAGVRQLFGWDDGVSLAKLRVVSTTAAAFLYPQRLFPHTPYLVLSDVNQVTFSEAARSVSKRLKLAPPSVSYRLLLPSLLGPGKRMSVKDPRSLILLDENADSVTAKLLRSFSGGCASKEQQIVEGGNPYQCSFFALANVLDPDGSTDMHRKCVNGEVLCSQCKLGTIPRLVSKFDSD
jgi:tryptophanyl-tRNA synthetase